MGTQQKKEVYITKSSVVKTAGINVSEKIPFEKEARKRTMVDERYDERKAQAQPTALYAVAAQVELYH